jgi:hypothetical protein
VAVMKEMGSTAGKLSAPGHSGRLSVGNCSSDTRVKVGSWLLAVFFLVGFCCLGLLSRKVGAIFEGMSVPFIDRFLATFGPIGFPLLGLFAAGSFVLSGRFRGRGWLQLILAVLFAVIGLWSFEVLMSPMFRTPVYAG